MKKFLKRIFGSVMMLICVLNSYCSADLIDPSRVVFRRLSRLVRYAVIIFTIALIVTIIIQIFRKNKDEEDISDNNDNNADNSTDNDADSEN